MEISLIVFLFLLIVVVVMNIAYILGHDPLRLPIEVPRFVIVLGSLLALYGIASLLFGLPAFYDFFG